jgi:hypothetical protein
MSTVGQILQRLVGYRGPELLCREGFAATGLSLCSESDSPEVLRRPAPASARKRPLPPPEATVHHGNS